MVDPASFLAALFAFVGNLLLVIYYSLLKNREHWDQQKYQEMDAAFLKEDWQWRSESRGLEVWGKAITAMSWVILTAPILTVCVVQSQGGRRQVWLHAFIAVIAMGGAITEVAAHLMGLGAFNAAQWITKNLQLENWLSASDSVGWQSLEVSYRVTSGMILWIDATEYLALFAIFILIFFSTKGMGDSPQSIGMGLGGLAFFIAFMSLADFVAYVIRFRFWETASLVGRIIAVLNRVILIPAWFLALSFRLPRAVQAHQEEEEAFKTSSAHSGTEDEAWSN